MARKIRFNNVNAVEQYLKNLLPLKLGGKFTSNGENLDDFLYHFLNRYNRHHPTLYAESGRTQCTPDCNRSIGDMFRITSFYYPNVKLVEVYSALFRLIKLKKISSMICDDIHKVVYYSTYSYCETPIGTDEFKVNFSIIPESQGVPVDSYFDFSSEEYKRYELVKYKIPKID